MTRRGHVRPPSAVDPERSIGDTGALHSWDPEPLSGFASAVLANPRTRARLERISLPSVAMNSGTIGHRHVVFLAVFAAVCCAWPGTPPGIAPAPQPGRLISAETMERSGARNAWEVIERSSFVSTQESAQRGAGRMWVRGHSSIYLDDTPLVLVDGIPQADWHVLTSIPVETIKDIRVLNGPDATQLFGTHAGGGAILVRIRTTAWDAKQ